MDDGIAWSPFPELSFVSSFTAEDEDSTCPKNLGRIAETCVQSTWLGIDTSLRELSLFHLWLCPPSPRPHRVPASSLLSDSLPQLPWFYTELSYLFQWKAIIKSYSAFSDETPVIQKPPAPGFPEFRARNWNPGSCFLAGNLHHAPTFLGSFCFLTSYNQSARSQQSFPTFLRLGMVTVRNPSTHH